MEFSYRLNEKFKNKIISWPSAIVTRTKYPDFQSHCKRLQEFGSTNFLFLDNQLKNNVFRAKGILWFTESERRHIFHLAGKRISIDDSEWEETKTNQLVLIGKDLDKKQMLSQLNACIEKE